MSILYFLEAFMIKILEKAKFDDQKTTLIITDELFEYFSKELSIYHGF